MNLNDNVMQIFPFRNHNIADNIIQIEFGNAGYSHFQKSIMHLHLNVG